MEVKTMDENVVVEMFDEEETQEVSEKKECFLTRIGKKIDERKETKMNNGKKFTVGKKTKAIVGGLVTAGTAVLLLTRVLSSKDDSEPDVVLELDEGDWSEVECSSESESEVVED
jgi:hypothetical protein